MEKTAERFADYVLALKAAAAATHRAEDRRTYELLLGDAAVLLALATKGNDRAALARAMTSHERLWGYTWLVDEVYREPSALWQRLRQSIDEGVT
ncbi:MAG: hypothetical protein ACREX4_14535 [Gammaproteobacteria bacterium]